MPDDHGGRWGTAPRAGRLRREVPGRRPVAAAHAPGQPRVLGRGRVDELEVDGGAGAADRARGGGADRRHRLQRPHHAGPAVPRPPHARADHGQAQPHDDRAHRRQPGQRPGHPLHPDQRHGHLLPAQAAPRRHGRLGARPGRAARTRRAVQGAAAGPPRRRPGRQPRLPGVPRLQPVPVEPAGHHDPVPRRRPVAAVHQRDHVPADPARRCPADDRRRPQLLPQGRGRRTGCGRGS